MTVTEISERAKASIEPIPIGYKQTEVGVIPKDWAVSTIAEKYFIATGATPPTSNIKNYGGMYLFVSPADLSDKKYIFKTEKKLSKQGFTISRKYPAGSTLFTCIGSTIGKTGLALAELTSNQQINAIFPNENSDAEFTYYAITYIAPKVKALAGQQAIPLVNKTEFGNTIFCFPQDKKEQTGIANALSDVDALIIELEKLIAKKQAIKIATMQQLLTGRTRLPQFALREDGSKKGTKQTVLGEIPEDWKVVILGDISNLNMGQSPSSSNYNTKGIGLPLIQGNADILNRKTIIRNYTSQITKTANKGDLLISVRAPVGEVAIAEFDCCIGRGVCALQYKNSYLYQWLVNFESQWEKFSKGSTFDSINSNELRVLQLVLPPDEEQTAIATILSDMDEEMQLQEQRLSKIRQIKQGMMQELLTGKTRLV